MLPKDRSLRMSSNSASTLAGQIAIVTGAASGIGLATAQLLAGRGARVLAVDVEADALQRIPAALPGECKAFACDLLLPEAPERILESCADAFGPPTILVNNAGIGAAKALHQTSDAEINRYFDLNLTAVMRLSREFLSQKSEDPACVVNIASIYALVGFTNSAPYSVSKAGIVGLTRQMAADYGRWNLRVNAVAPGLIVTPLTETRLNENPLWRSTMVDSTPLGRLGQPGDIAAAVAFLCSPDASFISGQILAVDGGWSSTRYFAQLA